MKQFHTVSCQKQLISLLCLWISFNYLKKKVGYSNSPRCLSSATKTKRKNYGFLLFIALEHPGPLKGQPAIPGNSPAEHTRKRWDVILKCGCFQDPENWNCSASSPGLCWAGLSCEQEGNGWQLSRPYGRETLFPALRSSGGGKKTKPLRDKG